eukprot:Protomagalhaensia_sp_Gyna_25__3292@NODE_298_length_4013_cov_40_748113_g230_i0_p3_GENE_NODE_298_length_4013_cov_40_748113_g230_i0NODE_298_length_4013_cov_40_748113_g230_i0_p3_ORF_typecomplete_len144_score26_26Aha1_N/PF09229_11/9_4e05_NODE_298_length_4013_cov_40_748113_g230_i023272758
MVSEGPKKEYSYTYWRRDTDVNSATTAASPSKIDGDAASLTRTSSKFEKSAWNAANTWEEKNVSKDLGSKLGDLLIAHFESHGLALSEVENEEAKASLCIVRGKPRLGFELEFSSTLKAGGKFSCKEFCDYDASFELKVMEID